MWCQAQIKGEVVMRLQPVGAQGFVTLIGPRGCTCTAVKITMSTETESPRE